MVGYTNVAAEFGLLSGICKHPGTYFNIAEYLSVNDFTQKAYKDLFIVLQSILLDSKSATIDKGKMLAKASELNIKDFYQECHDGELLDACIDRQCVESDVMEAFSQVKRETIRRSLVYLGKRNEKYLSETNDTATQIIGKIENDFIGTLNSVTGVTEEQIISLPEQAHKIITELAERPGELGLDVGFPIWQRGIGGLRNGSVTFIAATTKAGKSQLGVRMALNAAKLGIPVLICDTELNQTTQSVRAFGQYCGINYRILETGYWKSDKATILKAGYDEVFVRKCELARKNLEEKTVVDAFKKLKISYFSVNGTTVDEALPFMRRWVMQNVGLDNKSKTPKCLIVWDYIKLMRVDEVKERGVGAHDILGAAASALHDFAEKYNLPILAFGQTNRELDESIDCIAGAKKISELTDSASLFKRKSEDDLVKYPNGSHLMRQFVGRFGEDLNGHIDLKADLSIGEFQELGVCKPYLERKNDDSNNGKSRRNSKQD